VKKSIEITFLALVCVSLPGQTRALDRDAFGRIDPVLSYDPATGQTSPFYPIGWYHLGPVTSLETMQAMAQSGSNTVLLADVGTSPDWHYGFVQQDLDWAQQCGMKVVVGIWRNQMAGVDRNSPASYAHLNWINKFKGHPSLLGWQLGDEEAGNPSPDHIRETQDTAHILKQWDPNHQLWQVASTGVPESQIISYMHGTDVYSLDFYQIFKTTAESKGSGSLLSAYTQHANLAALSPGPETSTSRRGLALTGETSPPIGSPRLRSTVGTYSPILLRRAPEGLSIGYTSSEILTTPTRRCSCSFAARR